MSADLDFSRIMNWTPIGSGSTASFQGIFDGKGHVIRYLNINLPQQNYVGLFGYVSDAFICHLGIEGGSIAGNTYTGGVVGYADNSEIENCYNTAVLSGKVLGGIAGCVKGKTISNDQKKDILGDPLPAITGCYNTGTINGSGVAGGIVGQLGGYAPVEKSWNGGKVKGSNGTGGIVGEVKFGAGTVQDCYNLGIVESDSRGYWGGIAGHVWSANAVFINCYNLPTVINPIPKTTNTQNCYYLSDSEKSDGGKTAEAFSNGDVVVLLNKAGGADRLVWQLGTVHFAGVEQGPVLTIFGDPEGQGGGGDGGSGDGSGSGAGSSETGAGGKTVGDSKEGAGEGNGGNTGTDQPDNSPEKGNENSKVMVGIQVNQSAEKPEEIQKEDKEQDQQEKENVPQPQPDPVPQTQKVYELSPVKELTEKNSLYSRYLWITSMGVLCLSGISRFEKYKRSIK